MNKVFLLLALTLFVKPAFAIHIYGGSDCSNQKFELNYDGPGSNYAVGGFSHLVLKKSGHTKRISILVSQLEDSGEKYPSDLGAVYGDEKLNANFDVTESKNLTPEKSEIKVGDKCEAGELDYNHSEWTARKIVVIRDITSKASSKLGLKKGSKIVFTCKESSDVPVRCPESGKYGKDAL